MTQEQITKEMKAAISKIGEAERILQNLEKSFNDILVDDNGKNAEREYNATFNSLQCLKQAKKELAAV